MYSSYDRFRWAEALFDLRDYYGAAKVLRELLDDLEDQTSEAPYAGGLTSVRLLLARAYYHSAQLGRAESTARAVLEEAPTNAYAALLLSRTLERRLRPDEAAAASRLATALGAPTG